MVAILYSLVTREISIMNALKRRFWQASSVRDEAIRRQQEPLSCQRGILKRLIERLMQWKRRRKWLEAHGRERKEDNEISR